MSNIIGLNGPEIGIPAKYSRGQKFPESEIMKAISKTLMKNGGWYKRIQVQGQLRQSKGEHYMTPSTMVGTPDWLWLHPVHGFWGIEAKKSKGGRLSSAQAANLNEIERAGGVGIVICSIAGLSEAINAHMFGLLERDSKTGFIIY